ncbi:hypothetical protein ScPMuIL_008798 [Solemya velum]
MELKSFLSFTIFFAVKSLVNTAVFCVDPWRDVQNPCINNPAGEMFFSHPDPSKFFQCDASGRMYIIQCPAGETFDTHSKFCVTATATAPTTTPSLAVTTPRPAVTTPRPAVTTTRSPVTTPRLPVTTPRPAVTTTRSPVTTPRLPVTTPRLPITTPRPPVTTPRPTTRQPVAATTQPPLVHSNPCLQADYDKGLIYFAHPRDETKFIECDTARLPSTLSCATNLIWNQARLACIKRLLVDGPRPGVSSRPLDPNNPCTPENIAKTKLFFPHPTDNHMFLHCDMWGDYHVVMCPPGLVWNDVLSTCQTDFQVGN